MLDPVVSIRCRVTLDPGESVSIDWIFGAAESREACMALVDKYQDRHLADRVQVALVELSADLRQHVAITEGPDGLYQDVLETAPRLAGVVDHLTGEHTVLRKAVDGLLAEVRTPEDDLDVAKLRDLGTELVATLARHRQRGADLVYEAYEFDIGGDT